MDLTGRWAGVGYLDYLSLYAYTELGPTVANILVGQARGYYTFFSHPKWTPAIALGYALSIWAHFLVNGAYVGVSPG